MSDDRSPSEKRTARRDETERRRRRARVFGDVLPDRTSDEVDEDGENRADSDDWLRRQKPPHHD